MDRKESKKRRTYIGWQRYKSRWGRDANAGGRFGSSLIQGASSLLQLFMPQGLIISQALTVVWLHCVRRTLRRGKAPPSFLEVGEVPARLGDSGGAHVVRLAEALGSGHGRGRHLLLLCSPAKELGLEPVKEDEHAVAERHLWAAWHGSVNRGRLPGMQRSQQRKQAGQSRESSRTCFVRYTLFHTRKANWPLSLSGGRNGSEICRGAPGDKRHIKCGGVGGRPSRCSQCGGSSC